MSAQLGDEGFSELEAQFFADGERLEDEEPVSFDDLEPTPAGSSRRSWFRRRKSSRRRRAATEPSYA